MPRTGRPSKPTEEKRLLGNPGKRALPKPANVVALAPVVLVPATPIPQSGDEFVARILATAASAWISEPDRVGLLSMVGDAWDERLQLRRMAIDGPPEDADIKAKIAWIATTRRDLRDLEKQLTAWLSLLGLSPTDRSRLGVAEVKARRKLEELRTRREERGLHAG